MPCHVELTDAEIEANRRARTDKEIAKVVEPLQKRNDELTHENDQLREAILGIVNVLGDETLGLIPISLLKKIQKDQVEHRKEDLRRLKVVFTDNIIGAANNPEEMLRWAQYLRVVVEADPSRPLEPQLGFDPDEY